MYFVQMNAVTDWKAKFDIFVANVKCEDIRDARAHLATFVGWRRLPYMRSMDSVYLVLLYYTLHMRMAVYVSDAFVDLIDFSFVVV